MISHAISMLATADNARGGPVTPIWTCPGRAATTCGCWLCETPGRKRLTPGALRRPGRRRGGEKVGARGRMEPGNVFVMFFQTPIYE